MLKLLQCITLFVIVIELNTLSRRIYTTVTECETFVFASSNDRFCPVIAIQRSIWIGFNVLAMLKLTQ